MAPALAIRFLPGSFARAVLRRGYFFGIATGSVRSEPEINNQSDPDRTHRANIVGVFVTSGERASAAVLFNVAVMGFEGVCAAFPPPPPQGVASWRSSWGALRRSARFVSQVERSISRLEDSMQAAGQNLIMPPHQDRLCPRD